MATKLWARLIKHIQELEKDIPLLDKKQKKLASRRVRRKIHKIISLLRAVNGFTSIA